MQFLLRAIFFILSSVPFLAWPNIVSVDVQNFSSITSGIDFVTVHSSETIRPCYLNCGLFFNYGSNTLPVLEDVGKDFKDKLFFSDINFGFGLAKNWDIGISLAQVHYQSLGKDFEGFSYEKTGFTDIRINTKYRFFGNEQGGFASVFSASFNQIEDNPFVGRGAGPTWNLEFVADTTFFDKLAVAGNIGYRFRDPGTPITTTSLTPIGNQFIASVAASYLLPQFDTKIVAEIFSGFLDKNRNKDSLTSDLNVAEFLLGAKHDFSNSIAGHFGMSVGLLPRTTSADWRAYGGVNVNFGPFGSCEESKSKIIRLKEGESVVEAMLEKDGDNTFENSPQSKLETFLANVLFRFDEDELLPEGLVLVQRLAGYLKKYARKFVSIRVEGHTDSIGNQYYNIDLSERRAKKVKSQLILMGVAARKIQIEGFGQSQPVADNGNYQGRAFNRRVEFKVKWKSI